ncbi:ABC-F family ATP-binding cassette domain-containing protein [Lacticaseibacillus sharpeae]|uniref:ABC transporter ATPase n=1 Tax=Lacticaseibacillus sharpeae JCM 1186 = DSM 20505 TaxID=1291052 RepID=A0A0R1ZNF1_9LACO|nr:ABC-F family ATP-binding cassette domain-containing protein [Lacticaseibacillus sharpeae]KRM55994.1 ABC transporter ATPase [Lacticaseibacillus sharpeae JCM 1186 = DSM 20505]
MQTLTASGVNKAYGDKQLLHNIDFLINEGDRIGLIGVNGTGKTTLLRGLAGSDPFDSGDIQTPKNYSISFLEQSPDLDENAKIMDAVYHGDSPVFQAIRDYERVLDQYTQNPMDEAVQEQYTKADARMTQLDAWDAETNIKTILTQLHLTDLDQRIGALSGGQRKRVGLAQVLIESPDLLILDEPTNHLDFDSIAWLEKYLAAYKGALLVVTHDRYFLDRVANRIFELDLGHLGIYPGNYQAYVEQKATQVEQETLAAHKQAQLYKHELAWMREGAHARSTKQNARIKRFEDMKAGTVAPERGKVAIDVGGQRLGKKVIELHDASLTLGDHRILNHFELLVQRNQRIGITGINGAGKSSLLNVFAGKLKLDSGICDIGDTVKLGYYQQTMPKLDQNMRVIEYLQAVGEGITNSNGEHQTVTQLLDDFLFPRASHGTRIDRLSGGEQRRLYLLQILMHQPNVLLLDEPTNDLDIATLTVLENYLDSFAGTVITVSHDRYFLDKVADRLLIFGGNGAITPATGRFTDYLSAQQEASPADTKPKAVKPVAAPVSDQPKTKVKLTYAEQKEYETLMPQMDKIDARIAEINAEMQTCGDDYGRLGTLQGELDELTAKQDELLDRYVYLDGFVN